ncbi:MAG TPA: hypothetical protein VH436_13030 [Vicinamibacterales bacterium]
MRAVQARRVGLLLTTGLCALLTSDHSGSLSAQGTVPQRPAATALPRLPDGHPDLQGLWMKSAGGYQGLFIGSLDGTNFAAPGGGRGDGRGGRGGGGGGVASPQYEYTPEAEAERKDRLRRGYEDPEARCHLPGVPRSLDQPAGLYPVQIIQDEKYVALLHEAMHDVRIIPTDNSRHPRNYWAWDGDSRGRWEGDTLVVDVSNFNGRTWLDMAGNFVDDNEHVLERFTLIDRDTILYEATVTDPTVFVKPVQMRFTLKRVPPEQQILEYSCLEGERSLQHYTDEDGGKKRRVK